MDDQGNDHSKRSWHFRRRHRLAQVTTIWERGGRPLRPCRGCGRGAEALPTGEEDFGQLLRSVVGMNHRTNVVVKAYAVATLRKPNLKLVREYTDKAAVLFTSTSKYNLQLFQMTYMKGDWTNGVPVSKFKIILEQLDQLHIAGLVHGDVRLANMLPVGVLIDFAGVADSIKYPRGLQKLNSDGKRHGDVENAIDNDGCRH
jgi:hypothetical protein